MMDTKQNRQLYHPIICVCRLLMCQRRYPHEKRCCIASMIMASIKPLEITSVDVAPLVRTSLAEPKSASQDDISIIKYIADRKNPDFKEKRRKDRSTLT